MSAEPEESKRSEEELRERRRWAELRNTYERCVKIARAIWKEDLETAAAQQQTLAEQMRDRELKITVDGGAATITDEQVAYIAAHADAGIPVPLFTPRDRLQFLKEAAVALLISADRHNLTAVFRDKDEEPEGTDAEAKELADAGTPLDTGAETPHT